MRSSSRTFFSLEHTLHACTSWCFDHPFLTICLTILLTAASLYLASSITINTTFAGMLPEEIGSVRDLNELEARFGPGGTVAVVIDNAPSETIERFVEQSARELSTLRGVRYVDAKKPESFFTTHALYYLSLSELQKLTKDIKRRVRWEKKRANPLYVSLSDTPPKVDVSAYEKKFEEAFPKTHSAFHTTKKQDTYVFTIRPTKQAVHTLENATDFVKDIRRVLSNTKRTLSIVHPETKTIRVRLTGRYQKRLDQQAQIGADLSRALQWACGLVLLYLLLHFRSVVALFFLFVPLCTGVIMSFGFAGLVIGQLNILTAFVGSILLGLGVDHGIHLLSAYLEARRAGQSAKEAQESAIEHAGRGVVLAALTTAIAFLGISISTFRGFHEFGLITAAGVLLLVLVNVTLLFALLSIADRLGWQPTRRDETSRFRFHGSWLRRIAPASLCLALLLVCLGGLRASDVVFEDDFARLEDPNIPSFALDARVDTIMGYAQTPLFFPVSSRQEEQRVIEQLTKRKKERGKRSGIDQIWGAGSLIPAEQEKKRALLKTLQSILEDIPERALTDESIRRDVEQISTMVRAKPISWETLPPQLSGAMRPMDKKDPGYFVLIFPSISMTDAREVLAMAREVSGIEDGEGKKRAAVGESMVMADALRVVFEETPRMLAITFFFMLCCVVLLLRRFQDTLICTSVVVFCVVITVLLTPWFSLRLDFLNIVVLPALLGMSIDGAVHLILHRDDTSALLKTARAVTAGLMTSAAGFGGLLFVSHPGLVWFGSLAVLGLCISWFGSVFMLASWLLREANARGQDEENGAHPTRNA